MAGAEPTPEERIDLEGLTSRVSKSLRRLELAAEEAHAGGAYNQLAALSAQLTRSVEALAKLQGVGAQPDTGDKYTVKIELAGGHVLEPSPQKAPATRTNPLVSTGNFALRLPFSP